MNKISKFYVESAKLATQDLVRNWIILVASAVSYLIYAQCYAMLSGLGMTGGFLLGIIQIVLVTYFYSWVSETIQKNKLNFEDLLQFDYALFSNLISVAFIFFLVQFLVQSMTQGLGIDEISLFLNLGMVFLFNAIPEVIVVNENQSLPALSHALEFTRDKLIPWFAPLLFVLAPWLILSPQRLVVAFASSDPLLPAATIFRLTSALIPTEYLNVAVGVIVAVWFTLFRMHLFKRLD